MRFYQLRYIYIIIPILWMLLPSLSFSTIFRVLVFFSIGVLYIIYLNDNLKNKASISKLMLISLIYIGSTFIVNLLASNPPQYLQLYIVLLFLPIVWEIIGDSKSRVSNVLIGVLLLSNLITIAITIKKLIEAPYIARLLSHESDLSRELLLSGIGGYGMVYTNLIMYPIVILLYKKRHYFKKDRGQGIKILALLNLILVPVFLLLAGYSIAILILVFQIVNIFVFSKNKRRYLLELLFFVLFVLLASIYQNEIVSALLSLSEGTLYYGKIVDVSNSLLQSSSEGSLDERVIRYKFSLMQFLSSPLIGRANVQYIGGHSTIFDQLAQFGVLGIAFVFIIDFIPRKVLVNSILIERRIINTFRFSVLVILMVNTIVLSMAVPYLLLAMIINRIRNIE